VRPFDSPARCTRSSSVSLEEVQVTIEIREEVELAPLTTFGVGGTARFFAVAKTEADVAQAVEWAGEHKLPLFVLGGGSNLLVRDEGFNGLVLQMGITGIKDLGKGVIAVGAGENWDGFVQRMVEASYAGVECMAGIPGTVGGTPVQNVGAYGQEVSETIESVRAFDREACMFVELRKKACRFRYRQSRFNCEDVGRFIVTQVRFRLLRGGAPTLKYAELKERVSAAANQPATLASVAKTVREIRQGKGMLLVEGDAEIHTAGSFFKNPVVEAEMLTSIAAAAGVAADKVPYWPAGGGKIKLPAAWLLESAGFVKGWGTGAVGISSRHTLALVNRGGATFADMLRVKCEIDEKVWEKFGIRLEREPVVMR
jgi:UDP-N-acetylmuramate dehydrogenase